MSIEGDSGWVRGAHSAAERKAVSLAKRAHGEFLHATENGRYRSMPVEWWTSGFWPGILLALFRRNGEKWLFDAALIAEDEITRTIGDERIYGLHHDVGFQFQPTSVARFKLTGDHEARRRGFLATAMLMSRFNPHGGFLDAWNNSKYPGVVIVDTMMNLPLLFWASAEFDIPRFRNVAEAHADFAMRNVVRPDGSTNHIVHYSDDPGDPIKVLAGQGYAPDSAWTRGQAWALYGFALAHRYTGRSDYLEISRRIANNFLAALPYDVIPPWDFRDPSSATAPRDSSAGSIAASGLLELASLLPAADGPAYRERATEILKALYEQCFSGDDPGQDGLLLHATGDLPNGKAINVSLIYGDFFYLEALGKLQGVNETCW